MNCSQESISIGFSGVAHPASNKLPNNKLVKNQNFFMVLS
jgi:hypothetical protein